MAAVWLSGTIHTVRSDTRMGSSGYEMSADLVEPYKVEEWSPIGVRTPQPLIHDSLAALRM